MKKKDFMKVLALLLSCILLTGCGSANKEPGTENSGSKQEDSPGDAEDKITIAYMPKTLTNPYFVAMGDYAQKAADKLGNVEIVSSAPPSEDGIDQQIAMFESYIEKKVDGIVIVPCGSDEIVASIETANSLGIPVITLDTNANGGEIASFIGTNNYEGGKLAGEWIGENVKSGKVAIITGTPGNQCHEDRSNGFKEGIEGYKDIELVGDTLPCYGDRSQGMSQAENLLSAYPDLEAIYVTSDTGALGAGEAVKAAGKDVKVVGFDGSPEGAQGIKDGLITASVAQYPGLMGEKGVEALYELIVNGTKPEETVDTGCSIVEESNADDFLEWQ